MTPSGFLCWVHNFPSYKVVKPCWIIVLVEEQALLHYLISHCFNFLAVRHMNSKHMRKSLLRVLEYYSDERVLLCWNQNIDRSFEK